MTISTVDEFINRLSVAQQRLWGFNEINLASNYNWHSFWLSAGFPGGAAAAPAKEAPTVATVGAIPFVNPTGGNKLYIVSADLQSSNACCARLVDRLSHMSGLSGTVTTAQTVNTAALTRYTDGIGVEIWLEVYTTLGASATSVTCSYTNQAGTAGRTSVSVTWPASAGVGRMIRLPLQAGDTGVLSVQTVTLNATTGTAGNFGVTLLKPVTILESLVPHDYMTTCFAEVDTDACLEWLVAAVTVLNPWRMRWNMNLVEG